MKKLILLIIFFSGTFPFLENGSLSISLGNTAKAQNQALENLPDTIYSDPCAGLTDDYNTSMSSHVEQSGLLVTDDLTGESKYISMDDVGNNGTTSGWSGISFDQYGEPSVEYDGITYEIDAFVHTHPNSSNGPSPTDIATMNMLNSHGGEVDGMVISGDGMVRPYSSDGTNVHVGTPQSLSDYTDENCYLIPDTGNADRPLYSNLNFLPPRDYLTHTLQGACLLYT